MTAQNTVTWSSDPKKLESHKNMLELVTASAMGAAMESYFCRNAFVDGQRALIQSQKPSVSSPFQQNP